MIDFGEMYAFDMVDGDKTVGTMNVSVQKQKKSSRGENQTQYLREEQND